MTDFAQKVAEARKTGAWGAVLELVPYAHFIGLSASAEADGTVLVRMAYRPDNVGNPRVPALHGGLLAALMETAMVIEFLRHGESLRLPKVVNFTTEFYRPAGLVETKAKAEIIRHGRRLAVLRAAAWQADSTRIVAGGHGHVVS
jgi:uncharacterized protein (TIGR00369 family)